MISYYHIHNDVKCGSCGCGYCNNCFNGCPQCGQGKREVTTSSTGTQTVQIYNATEFKDNEEIK